MVRISVVKKDATALFTLAATALKRAGANDRMADAAARHLVRAEEQGLPTHGMSRVPFYCGMLRRGRAVGAAEPRMRSGKRLSDRRRMCLRLGAVGVEEAIAAPPMASRSPASPTASGVLGIHLGPVAEAGMVGFAFTNSPAAVPWGGKPLFGTDPVAGSSQEDKQPIVVDLAHHGGAGKIRWRCKGEDSRGLGARPRRQTDHRSEGAIEHGSLFPIGGAKGAMLALMFELISPRLPARRSVPSGFVLLRRGNAAHR
jgi:(2R)-3-sulfolactate dehydrogenase (NADP+)